MTKRCPAAGGRSAGYRPVSFPGGHDGFSGGEYGMGAGKPDEFAATLRTVLDR